MSEVEEDGGGDVPGVGKERGVREAGQAVTGVAESEAVAGCDLNEVYDIEAPTSSPGTFMRIITCEIENPHKLRQKIS